MLNNAYQACCRGSSPLPGILYIFVNNINDIFTLANKNVRTVWALLAHDPTLNLTTYRSELARRQNR